MVKRSTVRKSPSKKASAKSDSGKSNTGKPKLVTKKPTIGLDVNLLRASFAKLAPQGEELVWRFYQKLFEDYPAARPLFKNSDVSSQSNKLLAALQIVIASLDKPRVLSKTLKELGRKHQAYGAQPAHYQAVADTMLAVMEEFAGSVWTQEVHRAWKKALEVVVKVMLSAYEVQEEVKMVSRIKVTEDVSEDQRKSSLRQMDLEGQISAISKSQAVIEFDMDGMIITANENFLSTLGYSLDEIKGRHHSIFVTPEFKESIEYREFWGKLNRGEYESKEYRRLGKNGIEVWIQASYNPIMDLNGKPFKVVKYATDLTAQKLSTANYSGQIDAISKSMAVIEFKMDGTIISANENFLSTLGYSLDEIKGRHHSMFVEPEFKVSVEYCEFWEKLNRGEYESKEYKRLGKNGKEVWIQASYNPIMDLNGKPFKVVKYATDVTEEVASRLRVARLQSAVDSAQANLMICDIDLKITYVNPAVVTMLNRRRDILQKRFAGFDPNNLVGTCIDIFHKNPAHQRALLGNENNLPAKAEIKIDDIEFEVNATAILDANGDLIGNMVEWRDITEQKDGERQIESLIVGAVSGELDKRIDSSRYSGFMKGLSEGINKLLDAIVKPIQEGTEVIQALADGDLTRSMSTEYEGAFQVLSDAMNKTVKNLQDMVGKIVETGSNINTASNEIAQGNVNLSQRTEEQASSLEETASAIEQMSSSTKQNADNARQANQLSLSARTEAEKGGEVSSKTISAMSEINSASKKIADIIGVIDEIAFQTNLLALNAAVEAARAGEQGRGFAVVASEVRNLAQRSAAAAKEIKTLIKDSVEKVEEGSKLVDESGKSLEEIVNSVKKVSDIIAEIAAASQEQASGIEQVNKTVMQMDEMTQQNAALVEEAASSSEALSSQAEDLAKMMTFFKLDELASQGRRSASNSSSKSNAWTGSQSNSGGTPTKKMKQSNQGSSTSDDEWEEF